jgi:Asp-tRNA(Asn)/Glu-tRNA(Gln) amidotransferase A subunit family amidase
MLIVEVELYEIIAVIASLRGAVEAGLQVHSLDVQRELLIYVAPLRMAGAIPVGKTATPEFGALAFTSSAVTGNEHAA